MRLFPPESQVTVRPCEHTVHTAKFKSSSEPPKEIAARRVAPAALAVQLELVVVHLQHEGGVFSLNGRWFLYRGTRGVSGAAVGSVIGRVLPMAAWVALGPWLGFVRGPFRLRKVVLTAVSGLS